MIAILAGSSVAVVGLVVAYFLFGQDDTVAPATAVATQSPMTNPAGTVPAVASPAPIAPPTSAPTGHVSVPQTPTNPAANLSKNRGKPSPLAESAATTEDEDSEARDREQLRKGMAAIKRIQKSGDLFDSETSSQDMMDTVLEVMSQGEEEDTDPSVEKKTTPTLSYPDLVEKVDFSIVRINVRSPMGESIGSGFVVSTKGVVITNYHVIEGANEVSVEFEDRRTCDVAGFLYLDHTRDIAIIKLDQKGSPFFPISLARKNPRKGEEVAAFGAPLGLDFTATKGTVTNVREGEELRMKGTYIQTDASISPGNSGGPLVNMTGEVVGMNSFQLAIGQNLNFAISVKDIRSVLDESEGKSLQAITPESVPERVRGREREADVDQPPGLVDITGTERADKLLAQMDQSFVIVKPFEIDPSGRINEYMIEKLKKTLKSRLKLELTRITKLPADQPVIIMGVMFDIPEDEALQERLASELSLEIYVIMLDLDKEGKRVPSIVWREKSKLANLSVKALAQGNLTNSVKDGAQKFFDKFASNVTRARKANGGGGK